jgi:tetratricopeptide (TPR) repeat protein
VALGLAALACLPFLPVLGNDFVEWDDVAALVANSAYRGFGWAEIRWMLTTTLLGHYAPVAWLSWAVDYRIWGLNPAGFHLTNLLLHGANVALTYLLARRLLGAATAWDARTCAVGGAVTALFFGVHPLRVEAVAWATERRGLLAGTFALVAVLAYLEAAAASGGRRRLLLAGSVVAYLLALGAKASVLSLVVVLVVLDVYPLGRLAGDPRRWVHRRAWPIWVEKTPYLAASALAAILAHQAASRGANAIPLDVPRWLGVVARTLWFHVDRTVRPVGLSPLYELPERMSLSEPAVVASAAGVLGITVLVLGLRRRWPAGLAAWLVHGALLAPTMGLVHAGPQLTADRYSYLAGLGWACLVGAAWAGGWRAREAGRLRPGLARAAAVVTVAGLVALGGLTWRQSEVWRSTRSLWEQVVRVAPECARCRASLGHALGKAGAHAAALEQYEAILILKPRWTRVHADAGGALVALGRLAEAVPRYERVLAEYPADVTARMNLALALLGLGRLPAAVEQVRLAVRLQGPEGALRFFGRAREANPQVAVIRLGLMEAYLASGRLDLARAEHEAMRTMQPDLARAVEGATSHGS